MLRAHGWIVTRYTAQCLHNFDKEVIDLQTFAKAFPDPEPW